MHKSHTLAPVAPVRLLITLECLQVWRWGGGGVGKERSQPHQQFTGSLSTPLLSDFEVVQVQVQVQVQVPPSTVQTRACVEWS